MSQKVIEIKNLYKEYKLGLVGRGTLYRDLQSWWARVQNKEDPNSIIGANDYHKSKKNISRGKVEKHEKTHTGEKERTLTGGNHLPAPNGRRA